MGLAFGLIFSKQFTELMAGSIGCNAKPKQGGSFALPFPLIDSATS
jgi:signal transduction histidine kinase